MDNVTLLRHKLEQLGPLTDASWNEFAAQLRERSLDKGAFFSMEGMPQVLEVGFVVSGILRMYYVREDGREFNKSFLVQGDFCGVLDSLILGKPTRVYVDALTPTVMLTLPWSALTSLYERHHEWANIGRRFAEFLSVRKMHREASLLLDTAEDRYLKFKHDYGAIEASVPDYHVASYIGITAVALCRIKKRMQLTAALQPSADTQR